MLIYPFILLFILRFKVIFDKMLSFTTIITFLTILSKLYLDMPLSFFNRYSVIHHCFYNLDFKFVYFVIYPFPYDLTTLFYCLLASFLFPYF